MLKTDFITPYKVGEEFNYFQCSDLHIGNSTFDFDAFKRDFGTAKEADADIFIYGDILDMIVPSDVKRYNVGSDPYHSSTYVNDIIDNAVEVLSPYVNNIRFISHGNHETVFQKRHALDPLSILVYQLNSIRDKSLPEIIMGAYIGFINIRYEYKNSGGHSKKQTWFYDHGKGGSSEITKGTIGINRMMNRAIADVYLSGHTHNKVVLPCETIFDINQAGNVYARKRIGIITGSYLKNVKLMGDKYQPDYGYEKMRCNQSTGGVMITHKLTRDDIKMSVNIDI